LNPYEQNTEYKSRRPSKQAGGMPKKMRKKFHACPSINKTTERHPSVP